MSSKEIVSVSEEDLEKTMECPAVLANRFVVSVGAAVRITFLEQRSPDSTLHPRLAAALHPQDAIKLYKVLQNLLKDVEEQLERLSADSKRGTKNG